MAGLKLGNTDIKNVMLGNTALKSVYLGNTLLWSSGVQPPVGPDLDLDFLQNWGTPIDNVVVNGLNPGDLVFSRADTIATGWDENGVLRRSGSGNLFLWSEEFQRTGTWTPSGTIPVTADQEIAPDGTTTADLIDAQTTFAYVYQDYNIPSDNTAYVLSVYVKKDANESRFAELRLYLGGPAGYVQLNTKTGDTTWYNETGLAKGAEDAGDYWRLWVSVQNNGSGFLLSTRFYPASTSVWQGGTGTTGSIVAWGFQAEVGSTPGIYQKTEGTLPPAAGQPRFDHDPANANAARGILIEGSAVNINPWSADLTKWSGSRIAYENDTTAPDGTLTASRVEDANAGLEDTAWQSLTVSASTDPYCLSAYIKGTSSSGLYACLRIQINAVKNDIICDIDNGAITATNGTIVDSGVETLTTTAGVWHRFWLVVDNTSQTEIFPVFSPAYNEDGSLFPNPSSVGSQHIWGVQLEQAAYPSSYIPTTGQAETRAAETLSFANQSWHGDTGDITMFADYEYPRPKVTYFLRAGTGATDLRCNNTAGDNYGRIAHSGGSQDAYIRTLAAGRHRIAISGAGNGQYYTSRDGVNGNSTNGALGGTVTALSGTAYIGCFSTANNEIDGHIKLVQAWDSAKDQDELNTLTTHPAPFADLDLDFRLGTWAYPDDAIVAGPSSLTFVRASSSKTWSEGGLLLEAEGDQRVTSPEDLSAFAGSVNLTVDVNDTTAPNGEATADKLTAAGAGSSRADYPIDGSNSSETAASFYVKHAGTSDWIFFKWVGLATNAYFNMSTGVFGTVGVDYSSYAAEDIGNGWWRIHVAFSASGTAQLRIGPAVSDGNNTCLGGESFYAWGLNVVRNRTGFHVYQNAISQANRIRFDHDPANSNAARGVLIEGAATNIATYSEQFDHTNWAGGFGQATVTPDDDTAPDGTTTADKVDDQNASQTQIRQQDITISDDSTSWCFSVFIKKTSGDSHYAAMRCNMQGGSSQKLSTTVTFNTNTGVISDSTSQVDDSGVIDAGSYWRVWMVVSNNSSGNTNCQAIVYPAYNTDGTTTAANATLGFKHFWGAQLENTAYPTSYIATADQSVTREKETLNTTDFTWYQQAGDLSPNSYETVFSHTDPRNNDTSAAYKHVWVMRTAGASQELMLDRGDRLNFYPVFGNPIRVGSIEEHQAYTALAVNADLDQELYLDGISQGTPLALAGPSGALEYAYWGLAHTGASHLNGHIQTFKYWNERKTP